MYVCDILTCFSDNVNFLDYIIETNIISTIFQVLSRTEQYTIIQSNVQCLQIILNCTSFHRKQLLQMDILSLFKSIFQRKDKYLVGITISQCILTIITKEPDSISRILELKLIKDLIAVGYNVHSFVCILEIVKLLTPQNIHSISNSNLGAYLCYLFDKPLTEPEVVYQALNIIYSILKVDINFKLEINEKNLNQIYNLWKKSDDMNLSESAGQICQLLSLFEDEKDKIDFNHHQLNQQIKI